MTQPKKTHAAVYSKRFRRLGFRTEKALVAHFLASARKSGSARDRLLRTEFDATNGIADIVQIRLRRNWRSNVALGKFLPRWAYALRLMPYRRRFSTDSFRELTGSSRKTTLAILRRFAELHYCTRDRKRDQWIKQKQAVPLVNEIVAIEAKLSDWRRALGQAYRHLDFAQRSFVLLDATRSASAIQNIVQFKRLNVGLITLYPSGRPHVWFKPAKRFPRSSLRYWHANSELGRRLIFQVSRIVTVDDI